MATEKRLIDASDLVSELKDDRDNDCNRYMYWHQKEERDAKYNFAIDRINEAPTVDAVEVVRCKDCKDHDRCEVEDLLVKFLCIENAYCAAGERRTDG